MSDPSCFIEIERIGLCIGQANAVSGAFLTALASLIATAWRIFADRDSAKSRQRFEAQQQLAAADAEERIQKNVKSYIQLEEWRAESWKRLLARFEQAALQLASTTSGLTNLIDEGPHFADLQMIKETAKVLDVFGDFQSSISHFGLPESMAQVSSELVAHVTKVLLTLSPLQSVRQSAERRNMLNPLRDDLIRLTSQFMKLCREFESNPSKFVARTEETHLQLASIASP